MSYLILGPLEARDGDKAVEVRGGQQRKLLAILLLHGGEPVSRDLLVEELWDGKPPETAAKALQGYISSLRKQLGPDAVETVGSGYRSTVAPGDVDAHRFEELLAEARLLDRAPAAAKLCDALALWRGPALVDFAYDDFARNEIERLEELRLVGIERRIDLELALGHHDDLVPELEALVRTHPLRERFCRHLMVALYRSGRQADALDVYREARTALRDELGLEPSEELQALQRSILDHDAALAAPPRVDLPGGGAARREEGGRLKRRPLLAVVAGLAVLGGTAVALALTLGTGKAIVVPPNSLARIDQSGKKVESYTSVGRQPVAIAVGARGVWVANAASGTVTRLDPATGESVTTIGIGAADLYGIVVGFHSIWVADGNAGKITQIDPRISQVERTIVPPGQQPALAPNPVFFIAVGSGYVWATRGTQLLRIDPNRNDQVDGRLDVGTPTGLAAGGGYVWVTTQDEQLLRIDARTMQPAGSQGFSFGGRSPVYTRGALWLIIGNSIHRVDPSSLAVGDAVNVPYGRDEYPVALAADTAGLWGLSSAGNLARIEDGRVTAQLQVGRHSSAVAAGGGATWVAVSGTD